MRQTNDGYKPGDTDIMKCVSLLLLALTIALCVFVSGCETSSGSREFIPGEGWLEND